MAWLGWPGCVAALSVLGGEKMLTSMLAALGPITTSTCEPWCAHPCTELNGSPRMECGGCSPPSRCRPGEVGFDETQRHTVSAHAETSPESDGDAAHGYGAHGNPLKMPTSYVESFVTGACDLDRVDHLTVTREMLMSATRPFIISGLTANWSAHAAWSKDELLRRHAAEPFQLHATSHAALGDLLQIHGKYHMGHAVYPPGGCYSDPWRPYSPMLLGALRADYDLPRYLGPMVTFQMGVGTGYGIGAPAPVASP